MGRASRKTSVSARAPGLAEAAQRWQNNSEKAVSDRAVQNTLRRAIAEGPSYPILFRGQRPDRDLPEGLSSWSEDIDSAALFARPRPRSASGEIKSAPRPEGNRRLIDDLCNQEVIDSLAPGETLVTSIWVARNTQGLDINQILGQETIIAREEEIVADSPSNTERVDVVVARAGEREPSSQEIARRIEDAVLDPNSPWRSPPSRVVPASEEEVDQSDSLMTEEEIESILDDSW